MAHDKENDTQMPPTPNRSAGIGTPRGGASASGPTSPRVPTLRRLNRDTLHMQVYQELRRGLVTGAFLPGQPVTLRQLVKSLGTSLMPVRDAVGRLIAAGALEMLPNRSVIVPHMTRRKFVELSRLRQAVEGMASEEACRKIDERALVSIRRVNDLLKKAIVRNEYEKAFTLNRDFHFAIYQASQLQVVVPIIDTLWLQAAPFLCLSLVKHGARWSARHHKTVLEALESRRPRAARRGIERDIEETLTYLLRRGVFAD
jgi:DNA-binding GntR family transcriptional regulator